MEPGPSVRTGLQRGERVLLLVALAAVTAAAWLETVATAGSMAGTHDMAAAASGWSTSRLVVVAFMWIVMMVAMMLPSAAPMLLVHAGVAHRRHGTTAGWRLVAAFVSGYLLVWSGVGLAATAAQWWLDQSGLLAADGRVTTTIGGVVLVAAGAYQFTAWKQTCLRQCRTPMSFVLHDWRDGMAGSLRMGLQHGWTCTGCCLGLMAVMFSVGVMSLAWMAVVTATVAAEKVLPAGHQIARAGGGLLIGGGIWLTAGAHLA